MVEKWVMFSGHSLTKPYSNDSLQVQIITDVNLHQHMHDLWHLGIIHFMCDINCVQNRYRWKMMKMTSIKGNVYWFLSSCLWWHGIWWQEYLIWKNLLCLTWKLDNMDKYLVSSKLNQLKWLNIYIQILNMVHIGDQPQSISKWPRFADSYTVPFDLVAFFCMQFY